MLRRGWCGPLLLQFAADMLGGGAGAGVEACAAAGARAEFVRLEARRDDQSGDGADDDRVDEGFEHGDESLGEGFVRTDRGVGDRRRADACDSR